ncbi:MAG: thioredoxin domain-containing protein [Bacillota bacterium]
MPAKFHFSPRPNRAHEIKWREWGDKAFAEALVDRKLVLLAISGVWCHWCHVMDEKTYSDPEIIRLLNEKYIPIRVDTDQRPDINARYNMGGWPTTAILTPEGRLVTGGTYMPPEQLKPLLERAAELFQREPESFKVDGPVATEPRMELLDELTLEPYEETAQGLLKDFDPVYGGFGDAPKFPMVEAIELALNVYFTTGNEEFLHVALTSLDGMSGGGMYDAIEGGFFRYSTTRDWLIPHFEKMLEDNAGLLGVLLQAFQITGQDRYLDVARDVLRYLENSLYQEETGCWSGTQDADEEYYRLDMPERRKVRPPYIDRHIYVDWNGLTAKNLFLAAWVTGEQYWERLALKTLDNLWRRAYREGQGMAHVVDPDGIASLFGRLDDQVEVGCACLAAYQSSGEAKWLDKSRTLADFVISKLAVPDGGFYDIVPDPGAPGALAVGLKDPQVNARAARWLAGLDALIQGEERYASLARKALQAVLAGYRRYGTLASGMALAVFELLTPVTVVTVVGPGDQATADLHRAALRVYRPAKLVRLLVRGRNDEEILQAGYSLKGKAQAFICIGKRCLPPAGGVKELLALLERRPHLVYGNDVDPGSPLWEHKD